jgi:hypothetical protein
VPLQLPPFSQYQAPLVPLRGLWNHRPAEGDKLVNLEINWDPATTKQNVAVSLGGNSPVSLSQIAALYVDNAGCGSSVSFVFPDTGFELTIPANEQSLFPVFTNALTFYCVGATAQVGDRTVIQVLNSVPPPIALTPASLTSTTAVTGANLTANLTFPLIGPGIDGTLVALDVNGWAQASANGQEARLVVTDGGGSPPAWYATIGAGLTGTIQFDFNPQLNVRFVNGLTCQVIATVPLAGGHFSINTYYRTP